ncbi:MAG: hypothetical protein K6E40_09155 [Desulfovibrio sp.]|nr:hypothetical protein [Desulfovibrio sp.]
MVQLPQTSSRAFQQSATLQAGQTLVLAGFQQAGQDTDVSAGLLSASRSARYAKSILIITIEVEMAPPGEASLALTRGDSLHGALNGTLNGGQYGALALAGRRAGAGVAAATAATKDWPGSIPMADALARADTLARAEGSNAAARAGMVWRRC